MSTLKTLSVAAALIVGASTLAMAQNTMNQGAAAPNSPAAATGGSGSHRDTPKTGAADTTEKILKNQNGYSDQK
jgi:hypothetical protein